MKDFDPENIYQIFRRDGEDTELKGVLITMDQLREYHDLMYEKIRDAERKAELIHGSMSAEKTAKMQLQNEILSLERLMAEKNIPWGENTLAGLRNYLENEVLRKEEVSEKRDELRKDLLNRIRQEHGDEVEEHLVPLVDELFEKYWVD